MTEPEIKNLNTAATDAISTIVARLHEGYYPAATAWERHIALAAYFGKVSELVSLIQGAASHQRGRSELEIAQRSLALIAREVGLHRKGLPIDLYELDRATLLLALTETVVACLCIAEVLDLDAVSALDSAGEHLRVEAGQKGASGTGVRHAKVCLPFAKLVMRDFV